jgi:hypothetical protein
MKLFSNAREAKEFLVSRIVEEAQRETVPLSEVERKMLYFSETGWTLPDMKAVSDEFDRTYDQNEYEKKMAGLVRRAAKHVREKSQEESESWLAAIRLLKKQDHYILVMTGVADLRPPGDLIRLWGTGFAVVGLVVFGAFISVKYNIDFGKHLPSRDARRFYLWATAVSIVVVYWLLRLIVGAQRINNLIEKSAVKLIRVFRISERDN